MYGNRKVGKMSQYIMKQQKIMRSIRGSTNSGFQSMHHAKRGQAAGAMDRGANGANVRAFRGSRAGEFDRESQN